MNKIIEHATNILVVDDHPIVRKGIAALLCHTASYITEASCAAEAADISRTHNIDIAVIDIDLPDANGLELITRLRSTKPYSLRGVHNARGTMDYRRTTGCQCAGYCA